MARLSGVEVPKNKRIVISLTYIHGIGKSLSQKILKSANIVDENVKTINLSDQQLVDLQGVINKLPVEGDVRRAVNFNIKRLKEIGCYRGIRHRVGLPVRGQITQKNARTCKGPRKTVANKKKADSKK